MNDNVKEYVRWKPVIKKENASKGINAGDLHIKIVECDKKHPKAMCTDNVMAIVTKGLNAIGKVVGGKQIMAMDFSDREKERHIDDKHKVWSIQRSGKWGKELYLSFTVPSSNSNALDDEFDIEYDAWTVMNHKTISKNDYDDLKENTIATNAIPVIYPINASLELNHIIAQVMDDRIKRKMISFLVDELKAEEFLNKMRKKPDELNDYQKIRFLNPYVQTTALINEMVALELKMLNGKIKLELPNRMLRKDRYSSVSYGNYFVSLLDSELLQEQDDADDWESFINIFGKDSFDV